MAVLFLPDGSKRTVMPKEGGRFTLLEVMDILGAQRIEQTLLHDNDKGDLLIVDRDAAEKDLPINDVMCERSRRLVHGPALLCSRVELEQR